MDNNEFENDEISKVDDEPETGLTTSIYKDLKSTIKWQRIFIVILIICLAVVSIYHDYKWSEFDTIVVDSKDGGNANYIGNDGDVYNYGESGSAQEEKIQQE